MGGCRKSTYGYDGGGGGQISTILVHTYQLTDPLDKPLKKGLTKCQHALPGFTTSSTVLLLDCPR